MVGNLLHLLFLPREQLSVEPQVRELQEPAAAMENTGTPEDPSVCSSSTCQFHRWSRSWILFKTANKHKPHAIVSFQWRTLRTNSRTFAPPFSINTTWWRKAKSASQGTCWCHSGSTTSSWCSYRAAGIRRKTPMTCPPHHLLLHRGPASPSSAPLDQSPSRQDSSLPPSPPPWWLKITGLKRESVHL